MKKNIVVSCCILLLMACQTTKKNDAAEQKRALQVPDKEVAELILPEDVESELYADINEQSEEILAEERRFDISARNVDARVFFASLIDDSDYSVAIHPNVTGRITLSLKQVTLTEAISVIEDMYGYEIKLKGPVYHIYPAGMRIASFTLDYLFMNRMGLSRTSVLSGNLTDDTDDDDDSDSDSSSSSSTSSATDELTGEFYSSESDGTQIATSTATNYWAYLEAKIHILLGTGRDVIISPMSGVVTVRAYPSEIRVVRDFLEKETDHLTRQVILEMQLIEVILSDEYQQGISWGYISGAGGNLDSNPSIDFSTTSQLADSVIANTIGGVTSMVFSKGDFSAAISLLETQGDVNVLSKPRITAMNNQKAIIKVGGDEYFVTDFSTTTTTGTTTTSTPTIELTPFFSGISVDVTPKINDDDSVLLHIHPAIVDIEEESKTITYSDGSLVLPVAKSDVRESDTVVKANSGEVIVIGGLMQTSEEDSVAKVPFLGDIPWLGEAFTNRQKVYTKTELVILVKPQIVKESTWKEEIQKSADLIEKMVSIEMIYLKHFGLEKVPFSSTADPHFYINFIPHKEALEVITTALSFGEGILKITGEVGTGKTLLCNKLQQELAEQYHICTIDNAYLNAHELRCLLANKIGIEKSELDEQFLLTERIKARLLALLAEGTRVLVLVDEAQALPDVTLEALRLFSNLENDAEKLLQVVLFAQPELDLRLADPKLRQLRQRITFSYQLRALSEKEIEHYIAARLQHAGYRGARLFSRAACRKISQSSRGIPRLINVLAHKVLILSYGSQHYEITGKLVEEAVKDTEDAYALDSMKYWWWALFSFALLDIGLLLWWNKIL